MRLFKQLASLLLLCCTVTITYANNYSPIIHKIKSPYMWQSYLQLKAGDIIHTNARFGSHSAGGHCQNLSAVNAFYQPNFVVTQQMVKQLQQVKQHFRSSRISIEIRADDILWQKAPKNAKCIHFDQKLGMTTYSLDLQLSPSIIERYIHQ